MKPHIRKLLNNDATPGTSHSPSLPRDGYSSVPTLTPANNSSTTTRRPLQPISTFDSSMALTVVVLLTALFFMGFFSIYIRRFAEENTLDPSRRRRQQRRAGSASSASCPRGLDPNTVKSLPVFAYDGSAKEPVDCVVCLSEFDEGEAVKVIPYCGHVFHPQCIDIWLSAHGSCPLCRSTQLFPKNSDVSVDIAEEEEQAANDRSDNQCTCCDRQQEERSSTAESRGASVEIEREEVVPVRSGMRRTSSYSWSSGERTSLPRRLSF